MSLSALVLILAATQDGQAGSLTGYVFREANGAPPRQPVTVELHLQEGKARHRRTTRPDGSFEFSRVSEGSYTLTARSRDFVLVQDLVTVSAAGPNFAAVMLPKRRAGMAPRATVSIDQLSQRTRQERKDLQAAARLVRSGDIAGAIARYEKVLRSSPSAELYDAIAVLYVRAGRQQDAWEAFEQAIRRDPRFLFPYLHLAWAYLSEQKEREAAAVIERALAVDSQWATGRLILAEARAQAGDYEAAARHARAAAELVQDRSAEPHLILARASGGLGDCRRAREHLDRYLSLRTTARTQPEIRQVARAVAGCTPTVSPGFPTTSPGSRRD